jgi:hypothetical protein
LSLIEGERVGFGLKGELQVDLGGRLVKGNAAVVFDIGQTAGNLFELLVADDFRVLWGDCFVHIRSFFGLDWSWCQMDGVTSWNEQKQTVCQAFFKIYNCFIMWEL